MTLVRWRLCDIWIGGCLGVMGWCSAVHLSKPRPINSVLRPVRYSLPIDFESIFQSLATGLHLLRTHGNNFTKEVERNEVQVK